MRRVFPLVAAAVLAGCSIVSRPHVPPSATEVCRSTPASMSVIRWSSPPGNADRQRLDAWCAGVGPPLLHSRRETPASADPPRAADVAFISWNVHVGAGEIERFIHDLRAGLLTGQPVEHFVLMLQEAVRFEEVPAAIVPGARAAKWIGLSEAPVADIAALARRLDLSVFYVPSMRNGTVLSEHAPSDRGNAILSTLPLEDPRAIELPGERQRRVAVEALIAIAFNGRRLELSVGSAHFNVLGSARTMWLFGASHARAEQAEMLTRALRTGPAVLGADVNSWQGSGERAVHTLLTWFPQTPRSRQTTFRGGLLLDRMFFRLPNDSSGRVIRARERYGADHYPIVGWISRFS